MDKGNTLDSVIDKDPTISKKKDKHQAHHPHDYDGHYQWDQFSHEKHPEGNKLVDDFLNPRSMLTPGIAGSSVMLIANTLWVQFLIPQKWSALVLSFLFIIPILAKFSASFFENIIYFVFNSLIVFALAINTNFIGTKFEEATKGEKTTFIVRPPLGSLKSSPGQNPEIKGIQLASNDNLEGTKLLLADNQQRDKSDSSRKDNDGEKKKNEHNKGGNKNQDRRFFQKWF